MLFNFELKIQTDANFTKYICMKHLECCLQVVNMEKKPSVCNADTERYRYGQEESGRGHCR